MRTPCALLALIALLLAPVQRSPAQTGKPQAVRPGLVLSPEMIATFARPRFAIAGANGVEGDTLTFTLTRSGNVSQSVRVYVSTRNNNAVANQDYVPLLREPADFGPDQRTATVQVKTLTTPDVRDTRSFYIQIGGVPNGASSGEPALGTIAADVAATPTPPPPQVEPFRYTITPPATAVMEGAPLVFTVTRSGGDPGQPSSVVVMPGGGSAQAGRDYLATEISVDFGPNEDSKPADIVTLPSQSIDPARTIDVSIMRTTPGGGVFDAKPATGAIAADPPPPPVPIYSIQPPPAAVAEGGILRFVVTRSGGDLSQPATVTVSASGDALVDSNPVIVTFQANADTASMTADFVTTAPDGVQPERAIIARVTTVEPNGAIDPTPATGVILADAETPWWDNPWVIAVLTALGIALATVWVVNRSPKRPEEQGGHDTQPVDFDLACTLSPLAPARIRGGIPIAPPDIAVLATVAVDAPRLAGPLPILAEEDRDE